jgi:hypothetical protein
MSMDYISRVDELLVVPPFLLGTNPLTSKFQSHTFLLQVDHAKLQALIDQQLNAAFPSGPVHYRVPASVQRAWVAFVRYDRAESQPQPGQGWLAYTEAMIGFLVLREPHPPGSVGETELLTYLGVVYIDDSDQKGQIQDPDTLPIVLGREAYGLPKNPGQILYKPLQPHDPNGAELEVWDRSASLKLSLSYAIRVRPVPYGAPPPPMPVPPGPPFSRDRWFSIAKQFGVEASTLVLEPYPERERGWRLTVPGERRSVQALVWEHLHWHTKLVGLKQFPDPTFKGVGTPTACYRAAVETPLEEQTLLPYPLSIMLEQDVEFPLLNRMDLMATFGIQPTSPADPRKVRVARNAMWYQEGVLLFAKPGEVSVRDAP